MSVCFCVNEGTTLKLSSTMRLPNLSKDRRLPAILKKLNLNTKFSILNENTNETNDETNGKLLLVSSFTRLGLSEVC